MNAAIPIFIYLGAAVCTTVIAWRAPGRPTNRLNLIVLGILLGLLWPASLLAHAAWDMDGRR